jgi:uncharacterized protein HemX
MREPRWYDRRRVILASFLFALVLAVGATVYAAVQGVSLWRSAKRTGQTISDELASFDERAARTERLLAELERSGEALAEAQERLRVSRARLNVLTGSLERDRKRTQWLRDFVPYV